MHLLEVSLLFASTKSYHCMTVRLSLLGRVSGICFLFSTSFWSRSRISGEGEIVLYLSMLLSQHDDFRHTPAQDS